jgi:predicted DNA-binding transcriptional regulator AlpA
MKLLTRKEVLERLRISDTTLRMHIDWGLFPEPFTITGSRPHLWLESEIEEILKSCVSAKYKYYNQTKYHEAMKAVVENIYKNRQSKK